jgi:hypothetical protein
VVDEATNIVSHAKDLVICEGERFGAAAATLWHSLDDTNKTCLHRIQTRNRLLWWVGAQYDS